jgi:hypothetical protein
MSEEPPAHMTRDMRGEFGAREPNARPIGKDGDIFPGQEDTSAADMTRRKARLIRHS